MCQIKLINYNNNNNNLLYLYKMIRKEQFKNTITCHFQKNNEQNKLKQSFSSKGNANNKRTVTETTTTTTTSNKKKKKPKTKKRTNKSVNKKTKQYICK